MHTPEELAQLEREAAEWERWDPPVWWAAIADFVIADRHLPDGTRQHMVKGFVPAGYIVANAYVIGAGVNEGLVPPADDRPVLELEPWLGKGPEYASQAGIRTVGELRTAVARKAPVRSMSDVAWRRACDYFAAVSPAADGRQRA